VVEVEEMSCQRAGTETSFPPLSTSTGYSYSLMDLVQRTLLIGPPNPHSQQDLTAMSLLHSTGRPANTAIQRPIHNFKIDPSFFNKYPGLYDENAVSTFPPKYSSFVPRVQLPCAFGMDSVKRYMKTALQSKSGEWMTLAEGGVVENMRINLYDAD